MMELDNIECISSSDGMDDDEGAAHQHPHPFLKLHHGGSGNACGGVGGGGVPAPVISPVTSVHELLECPVCTNSMYPPIHQVGCHFLIFASVLESRGNFDFLVLLLFFVGLNRVAI